MQGSIYVLSFEDKYCRYLPLSDEFVFTDLRNLQVWDYHHNPECLLDIRFGSREENGNESAKSILNFRELKPKALSKEEEKIIVALEKKWADEAKRNRESFRKEHGSNR